MANLSSSQKKTEALTVPQALEMLRKGKMDVIQLLPWSSNYTFLAQISKDNQSTLAVYKPRRGERPLWDFAKDTLYKREIAAFVISDALGWELVPPTVKRQGEHGVGMVQLFIEHDPNEHFFTFRDPWPPQLTRMALFDVIINNADRKGGHCLRDGQGHIWGIDHGVCFHEEAKLRTVIWEPAGKPIPPEMWQALCDLQQKLRQKNNYTSRTLRTLLSEREISALQERLATLVASKELPLPAPDRRHVPWPMV